MKLQIDADEFDSTAETKRGEVYSELVDARKKLEFYIDQYQVELKAIERRKKILLWAIEARVAVCVLFIICIIIFSINTLFGFVAIILLCLATAYMIYSLIRCFMSWGYHVAKFDAKSKYTLEEEKQDIIIEIGHVREAIHRIDIVLKGQGVWNPDEDSEVTPDRMQEAFEEQGQKLLDDISYELIFKERRADYLYGERIR